jgi:LEA14-like dessication related protein
VLAAILLGLVVQTAAPSPLTFAVRIENEKEAVVTISGPTAELAPGPFRGSMALNGSPVEVPVSGPLSHAGGRWRLPVTVRFADVPADWADRFRPDGFTYRLKGSVGAAAQEWSGRSEWKEVEAEGRDDVVSQFLVLEDVRLTEMSLLSSSAVAELTVRNPLSFDLRVAETVYTLEAGGQEVGDGATRGLILHAGQENKLSLPIEIDHSALLSAAGKALLSGGSVDVRLTGRLVLRLKGGDLVVPLNLSGHLSDAS